MAVQSMEELRKVYESSPFNNYIGIKLEKFEEGAVVYSLKVGPNHQNVNQSVHGGVYFSILDTVMGATIRSAVKQKVITINVSINYLAAFSEGDKMYAAAKIVQQGRSIVTAEGEVTDCNGKVLAKTIGTFKIIREKK